MNGETAAAAERPVNTVGVKLHPTRPGLRATPVSSTLRRGQRVIIHDGRDTDVGVVAVATAPRPQSPGGRCRAWSASPTSAISSAWTRPPARRRGAGVRARAGARAQEPG